MHYCILSVGGSYGRTVGTMKLNDIVCRIGTAVRIKDSRNYIDGLYKLTAVIIRKNEKEYFYQAEVQQLFDDKSVLYVRAEMIEPVVK